MFSCTLIHGNLSSNCCKVRLSAFFPASPFPTWFEDQTVGMGIHFSSLDFTRFVLATESFSSSDSGLDSLLFLLDFFDFFAFFDFCLWSFVSIGEFLWSLASWVLFINSRNSLTSLSYIPKKTQMVKKYYY